LLDCTVFYSEKKLVLSLYIYWSSRGQEAGLVNTKSWLQTLVKAIVDVRKSIQ